MQNAGNSSLPAGFDFTKLPGCIREFDGKTTAFAALLVKKGLQFWVFCFGAACI